MEGGIVSEVMYARRFCAQKRGVAVLPVFVYSSCFSVFVHRGPSPIVSYWSCSALSTFDSSFGRIKSIV